ncbi:MAG: hypothetical protein WC939_00330 [Acholeplasmataceae bacterium]
MNNYKVGDKVLYNGKVHTVIRVPDDRLTREDIGYLDKDYVVLNLGYYNAIHYTEIEPYLTPHERLLKLGWVFIDSDGTYKTYEKFDDKYTRRTMSIKINKDKDGWYFTTYNVYMDKELTTILLEYLDELEKDFKEK